MLLSASLVNQSRAAFLYTAKGYDTSTTFDSGDPQNVGRGNDVVDLLRAAIRGDGQFRGLTNSHDIHITCNGSQSPAVFRLSRLPNIAGPGAFVISGPNGLSYTNTSLRSIANYVARLVEKNPRAFIPNVGRTVISVDDGNPDSTTVLSAANVFDEYAVAPTPTKEERLSPTPSTLLSGQSLMMFRADVGRIRTGPFDGTTYSLPLAYRRQLNERLGISIGVPLNYTEIEDIKIYRAGLNFGVPIQWTLRTTNQPLSWQITPSLGSLVGKSWDLNESSVLVNGALSSALSYDFPHFTLSMGNQFGFYESVELDGYSDRVSQQITRNGLKVGVPIGKGFTVDVWGIHTHLLRSATMQDFYTVGGAVAYHRFGLTKLGRMISFPSLYVGAYANLGNDYVAPHVRMGTAWKF